MKYLLSLILGLIILLLFISYSLVSYTIERKVNCHTLGGIYIDGQCFKAEIIKLD